MTPSSLTTVPGPIITTSPPSGLTISSNIDVTGRVTDDSSTVVSLRAALDATAMSPVGFDALGFFHLPTGLALNGTDDGQHILHLQATDQAGQVNALDYSFTLDRDQASTVAVENSQPGSNWAAEQLVKDGTGHITYTPNTGQVEISTFVPGQIEGFVTTKGRTLSAQPGDTIFFNINAVETANVQLDIYRMGYYGGLGSRKLATLDVTAGPQAPAQIDPSTGSVTCPWTATPYTLPSSWVTGVYVVKMTLLSDDQYDGQQSYMIFVVRNDSRPTPLAYQVADYTWQAYDTYGGWGLYHHLVGGSFPYAHAVSFHRPYFSQDDNAYGRDYGSGDFFRFEFGNVQFLEQNGYDLSYVSGSDVDAGGPNYFLGRRTVIDGGHDEYWTGNMWDAYHKARDQGVNLAFLGSNQAYWHIQYDPVTGQEFLDKSARNQYGYAGLFRDQPRYGPEGALLGNSYEGQIFRYGTTPPLDAVLTPNGAGVSVPPNVDGIPDPFLLQGVIYGETNTIGWLTQTRLPPPPPGSITQVNVLAQFDNGPPTGLTAVLNPGGSLTSGQTYHYHVTATTPVGETSEGAGVGVTASDADHSANLHWHAVSGALAYNVYRDTAGAQQELLAVLDSQTSTYTDDGTGLPLDLSGALVPSGSLATGTNYYWKITATVSPFRVDTLPGNEISLKPVAGSQTAILTWPEIQGAVGYRIYRGTFPGNEDQLIATIGSPETTTFVDSGVPGVRRKPHWQGPNLPADVVWYTAPLSGARVFSAGSWGWNNALYPAHQTAGALMAQAITGSILEWDLTHYGNPQIEPLPSTPALVWPVSGRSASALVGSAYPAPLRVRVTDGFGIPVKRVAVTFSAPQLPGVAGGVFGSPAVVLTDNQGLATAPALIANATAGSFVVTAYAAGVAVPVTFTLTNVSGTLTAIAGTPQSTTVVRAFGTPLQAKVTDALGSPVSGVRITFLVVAKSPGAGATFAGNTTVFSNARGVATAPTLIANNWAGSFTVTASAAGLIPVTFDLTNKPAKPIFNLQPLSSAMTAINGESPAAVALPLTNLAAAFISSDRLADGQVMVQFSQSVTADGTGSLTYDVISGALPSGLNLSRGGVLNGTPQDSGSFSFRVTATDDNGFSASRVFVLVILPALANDARLP